MKKKRRKAFWHNIKFKYKLTVTNENTLEEVVGIHVSKLNGLSWLLSAVTVIFLVAAIKFIQYLTSSGESKNTFLLSLITFRYKSLITKYLSVTIAGDNRVIIPHIILLIVTFQVLYHSQAINT